MFSGGLDLGPSRFFIPPVRPGLINHHFKALQGPSHRLRRKSSFSTRVVKYWNRLFTPIVTFRQFFQTSTWLGMGRTVCWSPVISSPSIPSLLTPNYAIPFYIIPIYFIPTSNSLLFINVLTLKLFCTVLPHQYVVIEVFFGPLYH